MSNEAHNAIAAAMMATWMASLVIAIAADERNEIPHWLGALCGWALAPLFVATVAYATYVWS